MSDFIEDMTDPTKIVWEKGEKEELLAFIEQQTKAILTEQTYKWVV
jgi:hypothetical protein